MRSVSCLYTSSKIFLIRGSRRSGQLVLIGGGIYRVSWASALGADREDVVDEGGEDVGLLPRVGDRGHVEFEGERAEVRPGTDRDVLLRAVEGEREVHVVAGR